MPISRTLMAAMAIVAVGVVDSTPRIVLDGGFDDWRSWPVAVRDARDAPGAAIDLREARVAADGTDVYLFIDVGREVNLQGLEGTLDLVIDADGDAATGARHAGVDGVDMVVTFSPRDAQANGRAGAGAALRLVPPRDLALTPYDAGVAAQPTHASRRFEIRIARAPITGTGLRPFNGSSWRGKLVFTDTSSRVRDETAVFTASLPPGGAPHRDPGGVSPLAKPPAAFRLVGWNVSRRALFERTTRFMRPLRALAPDVLALDEVTGERSAADVEAVLRQAGDAPAGAWQLARSEGGGDQRVVIASRSVIERVAELARLEYPPDALQSLRKRFVTPAVAAELSQAAVDGVPAFGTLVRVHGRRLLVVGVDLRCCGSRATFEDELRNVEARVVRAAVRAACRRVRPDGVLLVGDLNLVGSRKPLGTLLRGLDRDGSSLEVVNALHLDGRTAITWRDTTPRLPWPIFTPSRLDYLLYGDAGLTLARAFVFDTEDLHADWIAHHQLEADDTRGASDHLPVVGDFRWR